MDIETIHESYKNGQRKQAVEQIKEFDTDLFFPEYRQWLDNNISLIELRYTYFTGVTCFYHYWHNVRVVERE